MKEYKEKQYNLDTIGLCDGPYGGEVKVRQREWNHFTEEDYYKASEEGHRSFRRNQSGIQGQQITLFDDPVFHIVSMAIRIFIEKNQ